MDSALKFNGTSYVEVPLQSDNAFDGKVTVEFWNMVDKVPDKGAVAFHFETDDYAKKRVLCHAPWKDGNLYFDSGDWQDQGRLITDYRPYIGKWTHIALVSDHNSMTIYINGVLVKTSPSKFIDFPETGVVIGSGRSDADGKTRASYHNGSISNFRVWNRALTQAEIQKNMYAPLSGQESGLMTCLNFTDPKGAIASGNTPNSVPNTADGTLYGFQPTDYWEGNFACNLDKGKMVSLRDATYRKNQYTVQLSGTAIKGDTPYEIHFDTGSWTTSIPYGSLNTTKITVLQENVKDGWGNAADKVSGQLSLKKVDGTLYTVENYVFFALKDLPDDKTAAYSKSIMGAFPSKEPGSQLPSFPYAIAELYAKDNMGFGIVSDTKSDLEKDWDGFKSYLQIGCSPEMDSQLKWRTDAKLWRTDLDFCPEAVPGFKVKIAFDDTTNTIEATDLIATIDTGAPDLTLRLNDQNPQSQSDFATHFVGDGVWKQWGNDRYEAHAKSLKNAKVTIGFMDSQNGQYAYTFPVGADVKKSPNSLIAGLWEGDVPWKMNDSDMPRNRINLGNTLYFYCPVFMYDIKNKRVGFLFR